MCEMAIWFKHDYFTLDYMDGRKIFIPYSKVTSIEFDHAFPMKEHMYTLAIINTPNEKYSFIFRRLIDSFDDQGKQFSQRLIDDMTTLEMNILDRLEVDQEYKLILDTSNMGEILCL